MKRFLLITLLLALLVIPAAHAVCPVCTIAVAAGVGVLREWGVDDALTGLWYGALIVSSIAWFIAWLDKKNIHYLFRKLSVIVVFYALFIIPLYPLKILGLPGNTVLGMDRMLFGTIIGSALFVVSMILDWYFRKVNEGKAAFKYQKVVVPITLMVFGTVAMYLVLRIIG
jgi:hypothetical protein